MKILVAEDDLHIRQGLYEVLTKEGYNVLIAENGEEALEYYHTDQPDFVLLDIMMPKMDGYTVCREIRKSNEAIPIVFLSAKDEEIDRVVGLELGADDYISKPFGLHELRVRIKTIARRCLQVQKKDHHECASFPIKDMVIYPDELRAKRDNTWIELSLREVKILECLWQHRNKVVTRDMLFNYAWGYDHLPNSRTLDQHISKLRKLIEQDPTHPEIITTVHGQGYRVHEE